MVHKRIVSLRRYILVPTTYVIVENIKTVYTDFFVHQRYKLYIGIIRFLESVLTFTKIVNMVATFATMALYFGCPKEPSHWYGTFVSDTVLYFTDISFTVVSFIMMKEVCCCLVVTADVYTDFIFALQI